LPLLLFTSAFQCCRTASKASSPLSRTARSRGPFAMPLALSGRSLFFSFCLTAFAEYQRTTLCVIGSAISFLVSPVPKRLHLPSSYLQVSAPVKECPSPAWSSWSSPKTGGFRAQGLLFIDLPAFGHLCQMVALGAPMYLHLSQTEHWSDAFYFERST